MFNSISIGARLTVLTGSLLALLAVVGFMGIRGMTGASDGLRSVYENNTVPLVQLGEVLDVVYHSRALIITGMSADSSSAADVHYKQVEQVNADLRKTWDAYKSAQSGGDGKSRAAAFDQAWSEYAASGAKTIELARSGDYDNATNYLKTESAKKFDAARTALLDLMRTEKDSAKAAFERSQRAAAVLNTVVLATLAAGLVLGGWLSFATVRSVTTPLTLMQTTIGEVERSSDFSRRVAVAGDDEVGRTAKSFNDLLGELQQSFRVILDNVAQVSEAAHRLSDDAQQVADSSARESEDTAAMAATVQQVTVSINHISSSAHDALGIANEAGTLSVEGGKIIHDAAAEMTQIADTVRQTSTMIETLGQQSNQISSIVQVIKDVADQTNLLALNAAIEAARAGEQGRGFAVVADEVRKLAERTTGATEEITQMIASIQASAHAAVSAMGGAVRQVDGGVALANRAGDAINRIRDGADRVIAVVNDISQALAEQSSASDDLAGHVEKVAQITERNSIGAKSSAQEAETMDRLAKSMGAAVSRFRI